MHANTGCVVAEEADAGILWTAIKKDLATAKG